MIFTICPCPVCPGFGEIVVLVGVKSGTPGYFCPACETAWRVAPIEWRVDRVESLDEVMNGEEVRLAELADLSRLGISNQVHPSTEYDELSEVVGTRSV